MIVARPFLRRARHVRAFTLIEMMMALAVFILLAGAVFGLMTGVLQSSNTLRDNQDQHDVVDSLNLFLKMQFDDLPAGATLNSYKRGDGDGLDQNGIVYGTANQATVIDAVIQANGYFTLRLATYISSEVDGATPDARTIAQTAASNGDDSTLTWTTLVTDLKTIEWKFQDNNASGWADLWIGSGRPSFVEFTMLPAGDTQPVVMDYWLPKIDPITLTINTNAASTNAP